MTVILFLESLSVDLCNYTILVYWEKRYCRQKMGVAQLSTQVIVSHIGQIWSALFQIQTHNLPGPPSLPRLFVVVKYNTTIMIDPGQSPVAVKRIMILLSFNSRHSYLLQQWLLIFSVSLSRGMSDALVEFSVIHCNCSS